MPSEEKKNSFKGLKSMFIGRNVTRMRDIEDMYPTNIAKALGINHSRYIEKLYNPEGFTFKHVLQLSKLLDVDIQLIIDVIKKEMLSSQKISKKKSL